jgi:uncharacterized membrane protein
MNKYLDFLWVGAVAIWIDVIAPFLIPIQGYLIFMIVAIVFDTITGILAAMKQKKIIIQHDNAPPHKAVTTQLPALVQKSQELGIEVIIREQPPNSPDLNVLDLGIFRALQSLQFKNCPKNEMELIQQTKQVFNDFSFAKLDNV